MNIFDIVGPIMVGPSSSHTAGVVRIGNVVHKILGGELPSNIHVRFHGSFATTYIGHGSDKAIIGGILGFLTDDERIKDSLEIAEKKGVYFSFKSVDIPGLHPNTILVDADTEDGNHVHVHGESIGGANIIIRKINDVDMEFDGDYDTLIISHKDTPGAISLVTNLLSVERINIAKMKVYRSRRGGTAIMLIEADGKLASGLLGTINTLPMVERASIISGLNS